MDEKEDKTEDGMDLPVFPTNDYLLPRPRFQPLVSLFA
jgi:hypothetical protein